MKPTSSRSVPSPLEAHLGYWLRYVSNRVSAAFADKVAECGVSVAEWVLLRELYGDGSQNAAQAPSTLADKTGMTRGGITKLADKLIAKKLIARTPGADDRRYQVLALTREGYAMVPRLAALADRNDEDFFGHMTATERKTVERAMRDIVRRLGLTEIPTE